MFEKVLYFTFYCIGVFWLVLYLLYFYVLFQGVQRQAERGIYYFCVILIVIVTMPILLLVWMVSGLFVASILFTIKEAICPYLLSLIGYH